MGATFGTDYLMLNGWFDAHLDLSSGPAIRAPNRDIL
jgi:hypothetical protein